MIIQRIAFVFILLFSSLQAQVIIEPCKFGQPLIDALQTQYTPTSYLGYNHGRDTLYAKIDQVSNNLSCIYTGFTVTLDPAADPTVSAFQGGAGLNAEHIYPQAKGAGDEPARGDMYNFYPCKVNVNTDRGNCPYAEIDDNATDRWYYNATSQTTIPTTLIDAYSEKDNDACEFEPREAVKGDLARVIFYFYAIYQSTADGKDPAFFPGQKSTLLQWHYLDPVNPAEHLRDSLIGVYQGNRNPFVLDSSLARRAFFEANASYPPGDTNCFSLNTAIDGPTAQGWITLDSPVTDDAWVLRTDKPDGNVQLYDLQGRLLQELKLSRETRIETTGLNKGHYVLIIRSLGRAARFRVINQ